MASSLDHSTKLGSSTSDLKSGDSEERAGENVYNMVSVGQYRGVILERYFVCFV